MFFTEKVILMKKVIAHIHESPMIMIIPLVILSSFAVFLECFLKVFSSVVII